MSLSLSDLRAAIQTVQSEAAEVNAITRALAAAGVRRPPRVLSFSQGRQVARGYVWAETPLGAVALVAGPSMRGTVYAVERADGEIDVEDVDVVLPDGRAGWVAWKPGRSPSLRGAAAAAARAMRGNDRGRELTRGMVGRATYPLQTRANPISPTFAAELRALRERATVAEPEVRIEAGARAPLFGPLYDAAGRKYRVLYRVLATAVDGSGPVLASNMPGTYADTPGYPLAFQARSLKRTGERVKIERIASDLDADRLLLPHADPTFGAPVVWEGNGEQGTKPGRYYVLGGNSRTLAFLSASDAKIRGYEREGRVLWPDVWPDEPAPAGFRYLLVRQVYPADCPSMEDALALNAACQMPFVQAQALAGATQQSMAGRETPLGEALSLVRGLGLAENIAAELPGFEWRGVVARDNVGDFAGVAQNKTFLGDIQRRIGAERFSSYMGDPDNAALLVNSVLIGFLPRDILDRGFGNEREERALLSALPILATLAIAEKRKAISPGWDLLPHLSDARLFADAVRSLSLKGALERVEEMYRQETLALRTREGDAVLTLADRIGPLGVLLGLTIKRAEAQRDPSLGIESVLGPYADAAFAAAETYPVAQRGLFGGGGAAMPPGLPAETLGRVLAEAMRGPGAEPIIPRTRGAGYVPPAPEPEPEPEPAPAPAPSMFGRPAPMPAPAPAPAPVGLTQAQINRLLFLSDIERDGSTYRQMEVSGYDPEVIVRFLDKQRTELLNVLDEVEQAAGRDGERLTSDREREVVRLAREAVEKINHRLNGHKAMGAASDAFFGDTYGDTYRIEANVRQAYRDRTFASAREIREVVEQAQESILRAARATVQKVRDIQQQYGIAPWPTLTAAALDKEAMAAIKRLEPLVNAALVAFEDAQRPPPPPPPVRAPAAVEPSGDALAEALLRQAGLSSPSAVAAPAEQTTRKREPLASDELRLTESAARVVRAYRLLRGGQNWGGSSPWWQVLWPEIENAADYLFASLPVVRLSGLSYGVELAVTGADAYTVPVLTLSGKDPKIRATTERGLRAALLSKGGPFTADPNGWTWEEAETDPTLAPPDRDVRDLVAAVAELEALFDRGVASFPVPIGRSFVRAGQWRWVRLPFIGPKESIIYPTSALVPTSYLTKERNWKVNGNLKDLYAAVATPTPPGRVSQVFFDAFPFEGPSVPLLSVVPAERAYPAIVGYMRQVFPQQGISVRGNKRAGTFSLTMGKPHARKAERDDLLPALIENAYQALGVQPSSEASPSSDASIEKVKIPYWAIREVSGIGVYGNSFSDAMQPPMRDIRELSTLRGLAYAPPVWVKQIGKEIPSMTAYLTLWHSLPDEREPLRLHWGANVLWSDRPEIVFYITQTTNATAYVYLRDRAGGGLSVPAAEQGRILADFIDRLNAAGWPRWGGLRLLAEYREDGSRREDPVLAARQAGLSVDDYLKRQAAALREADEREAQTAEEARAAAYQRAREAHDRQADEARALMDLGALMVPGLRPADQESAGRLYREVEAGRVSVDEWRRYVAGLRAEGRITQGATDALWPPATSRAAAAARLTLQARASGPRTLSRARVEEALDVMGGSASAAEAVRLYLADLQAEGVLSPATVAAWSASLADEEQGPAGFSVGDELWFIGPGGLDRVNYRGPAPGDDGKAVVVFSGGMQGTVPVSGLSRTPPAAPAASAGTSKADRIAALLRSNRGGYRPNGYRPNGYRRNGVELSGPVETAIRRILAEKYRRSPADVEALLALLRAAVAKLDADQDVNALAGKILASLDQILAIYDEPDETPAAAPAPVVAPVSAAQDAEVWQQVQSAIDLIVRGLP